MVTDATGQTAEASVTIYVILEVPDSDHVMRRGETYRVHGFLITVPSGYDAQLAGMSEPECSDVPAGERCGPAFGVQLVGVDAGVSLFLRDGVEERRWHYANASGVSGASDRIAPVLDEIVASVGNYPE